MYAPRKSKWVAAAAAPFAITLALGTMPAYADEGPVVESTSVEEGREGPAEPAPQSKAAVETEPQSEAPAETEPQSEAAVEMEPQSEVPAEGEVPAEAEPQSEAAGQGAGEAESQDEAPADGEVPAQGSGGQDEKQSGAQAERQIPAQGSGGEVEGESGTPVEGAEKANSEATITLAEGCVVESSKEISYIAFFVGGELVFKDESVGEMTFDLSTVSADFDSVEVKAGTTVETFPYTCAVEAGEGGDIGGEGGAPEDDGDAPAQGSGNVDGDGDASGGAGEDGASVGAGDGDAASGAGEEDASVDAGAGEEDASVDAGAGEDSAPIGAGDGDASGGAGEDDVSTDTGAETPNTAGEDEAPAGEDEAVVVDDAPTNGGADDTQSGENIVAGVEAEAQAPVAAGVGTAMNTPEFVAAPQVFGVEADAVTPLASQAAPAQVGQLPNTGAEENAALITGGAGLFGLGALLMLRRRRFGFER